MVSVHVCVLLCEYVFLFVLGRKIKNCIVLECFSILNSTVLILMKNSLKRIKEKIFKRKNCFISMHTARVAMGTQIQEWERTFFQSVLGRSISTGSGRKPDVIVGNSHLPKGCIWRADWDVNEASPNKSEIASTIMIQISRLHLSLHSYCYLLNLSHDSCIERNMCEEV